MERAHQLCFSDQLLKQQLLLFGKIARAPDNSLLRSLTFTPGSLRPTTGRYIRRVGRPANEWASKVHETALKLLRIGSVRLEGMIRDIAAWRSTVSDLFKL